MPPVAARLSWHFRRLSTARTAIGSTAIFPQAFCVGDCAAVPGCQYRSHRRPATSGHEFLCRRSGRFGFFIEHPPVLGRRALVLCDQQRAARHDFPRCKHQIGHHRRERRFSAPASFHHERPSPRQLQYNGFQIAYGRDLQEVGSSSSVAATIIERATSSHRPAKFVARVSRLTGETVAQH
jgi:hypothetical protein